MGGHFETLTTRFHLVQAQELSPTASESLRFRSLQASAWQRKAPGGVAAFRFLCVTQ